MYKKIIPKIFILLLVIVCSSVFQAEKAEAAISSTPIQQKNEDAGQGGGNTSETVTLTNTPVQGNTLILMVGTGVGNVLTSVSQTNVTWTKAVSSNTFYDAEIWYGNVGASAGKVITVTNPPIVATLRMSVSEWSGLDANPLAVAGSTHGTSTTAATQPVTPAAGRNALIISVTRLTTAKSAGPTAGFTALTSSTTVLEYAYQVPSSSSGAYTNSYTQTSGNWESQIAVFYPPPIGAVPIPSITSPSNGSNVPVGTVAFTGSASDTEDGALTGNSLVWSSSIDGALGTGASISHALTSGTHTITLTATDSNSNVSTTSITLYVGAAASIVATVQPHTTRSGLAVTPGIQITARNFDGSTNTSATGNVTLTKISGSGTLSGTTTAAFVSGVATFNNIIITGTGSHTLRATASATGYTVDTNSFKVREVPYTTTGNWSTPGIFFEDTSVGADMDIYYQFFVPTVANGATAGNALPLIIYIGGAGALGQDHNTILNTAFAQQITTYKNTFPYLALFPQIPNGAEIDSKVPTRVAIPRMIQMLRDDGFNIDMSKIYFVGYSSGGIFGYTLPYVYPDLLAAVVTVDGAFSFANLKAAGSGIFENVASVVDQTTAEAEFARVAGPGGTALLFEHGANAGSDQSSFADMAGIVSQLNAQGYPISTAYTTSTSSNIVPTDFRKYDLWYNTYPVDGVDHGPMNFLPTELVNTPLWYNWMNARQRPANFSAISAGTPGTATATISWTTDRATNSLVQYGTTTSYGSATTLDASLVTSHSTGLTGLSPNTLYHYRVVSADINNNTGYSTDQTFTTDATDSTPPTVSVTAPTNTSTVSGASVSVTANASDNIGVAGVQFKDGSTNIGAEDTTSSYGVTWDTTAVTDGAHTLTAVARDAAGNTTTSTGVTVTVDNTAPVRSAGTPSGTLTLGTASTSVSLSTNENATCKYSTTAATSYGSMTSFNTTGSTTHSSTISVLTNGGSYIYYVKCADGQGNTNATDYTISFAVDLNSTTPPVEEERSTSRVRSSSGRGIINFPAQNSVVTDPTVPAAPSNTIPMLPGQTPNGGIIFAKNHHKGDMGEDIRILQRWLNTHGFVVALTGSGSFGSETTFFGPLTVKAVVRYQASKGLPTTGYFGPMTRTALSQ